DVRELGKALQGGHPVVAHARLLEVQAAQVLEARQRLQAGIRHAGVGQVQPDQLLAHALQGLQRRVVDLRPRQAEVHADQVRVRGQGHGPAAQGIDLLERGRVRRGRRGELILLRAREGDRRQKRQADGDLFHSVVLAAETSPELRSLRGGWGREVEIYSAGSPASSTTCSGAPPLKKPRGIPRRTGRKGSRKMAEHRSPRQRDWTPPSARRSLPPVSRPSASRRITCPRPNSARSKPDTPATSGCPRPRRPSTVEGGSPASRCTRDSEPSTGCTQNRGRSTTACGSRRSSASPTTTWTWPWGCMNPPMTPNGPNSEPSSRVSRPGMIV